MTTAKKAPPAEKPVGSKVPKWKAQSEMFRAAMRAVKTDDEGGSGGGQAFSAPVAEQHDDRTECRHCGRKFNEQAAERHIPLCEKKAREMKNKAAASNIKNKTGIGFARK